MTRIEQLKAENKKHMKELKALAKAQGMKTESQKQRELLEAQGGC